MWFCPIVSVVNYRLVRQAMGQFQRCSRNACSSWANGWMSTEKLSIPQYRGVIRTTPLTPTSGMWYRYTIVMDVSFDCVVTSLRSHVSPAFDDSGVNHGVILCWFFPINQRIKSKGFYMILLLYPAIITSGKNNHSISRRLSSWRSR